MITPIASNKVVSRVATAELLERRWQHCSWITGVTEEKLNSILEFSGDSTFGLSAERVTVMQQFVHGQPSGDSFRAENLGGGHTSG